MTQLNAHAFKNIGYQLVNTNFADIQYSCIGKMIPIMLQYQFNTHLTCDVLHYTTQVDWLVEEPKLLDKLIIVIITNTKLCTIVSIVDHFIQDVV